MALLFFVFMPPIYLFCTWEATYPIVQFLRVWWAKISMFFAGYFYKAEWGENIDKKRNYVVVFNHTSHLDIVLAFAVLEPMLVRFMAKAELAKIPLFGKFFRTIDFSVQRDDAQDAKKAFGRADEALDKGYSIAISPEGGTSKNPPNLRNFKSGAFRLAIQHQVPILVLTMYDNWRIMPSNGGAKGPHISRVKIHTPIETKGMKLEDYRSLSDKVYQLMQTDLQEAFPKEMQAD
jgi:1-acyl-sn-glycerol-3-phosphate acyltransferase